MNTATTARIAISRDNLPKVIAKAFDLSKPQGTGFLHFKPGDIPEGVLNDILSSADKAEIPYRKSIHLDYVEGRAIKLGIYYDEGSQQWQLEGDRWYDHSSAAWEELKEYAKSL